MSPEAKSEISWRHWPLRDNGLQGWLNAGFVALLMFGVWLILLVSLPTFAAVLIGAAFIGFLLPYFLPSYYKVGSQGVQVQQGLVPSRLRRWNSFGSYKSTAKGFWLVPAQPTKGEATAKGGGTTKGDETPPLLQPLRAVFLPYPVNPKLKAALTDQINRYLPSNPS